MARIDRVTILGLALLAAARPAVAQEDDWARSLPWPFGVHEYGNDVTRPGATPGRPYWHGDDAVPRGLRWHDQGWEGSPVEGPPAFDDRDPRSD